MRFDDRNDRAVVRYFETSQHDFPRVESFDGNRSAFPLDGLSETVCLITLFHVQALVVPSWILNQTFKACQDHFDKQRGLLRLASYI